MADTENGQRAAHEEYVRKFTRQLLSLSRKRNRRSVFGDYCRLETVEILTLIGEATDEDIAEHNRIAAEYSSEEERGILRSMSELTLTALAAIPYRDLLGEVFMYHDMGRGHNDQYFTHRNIAVFMSAALSSAQGEGGSVRRIREKIERMGFSPEADTSCGSGVFLLSQAEIARRMLHLDPGDVLILDGTDIDRICADMCYIQLAANNLTGIVRWDNGLCHQDKYVMMTPRYKKAFTHAQENAPELAAFLTRRLSLKRQGPAEYG